MYISLGVFAVTSYLDIDHFLHRLPENLGREEDISSPSLGIALGILEMLRIVNSRTSIIGIFAPKIFPSVFNLLIFPLYK